MQHQNFKVIACSTWPTTSIYGCTGSGGDWELLDNSLREPTIYTYQLDSTKCEQKCISQGTHGCCYLDNELGCYWKQGSDASHREGDHGIAVACAIKGK